MSKKISFQGVRGAYSHLACLAAAPDYIPLPCPDFESAIAAVHDGSASLAMLPIDNSIAGRVADIHHLLPKSRLYIINEHFQPVQHCLLGVKGSTLADIQTVSSHIHALPQCRDIIAKNKWKKTVAIDTAAAAEEVAKNGDKTVAAIASSLAAEIYGLDILATDIADIKDNTTRFVIMSPEAIRPDTNHTRVMTSLVFRVRSVPAALYKALGGFASNGVNLTKIESYLVDGAFDAAQFYCEIEGHPDSPSMQRALEELEFFGKYEILGAYPAHQFRLTKTPGAVLD